MTDIVRTQAQLLALLEPLNLNYANPRATVLQSQLARDLIISIAGLAGVGVLVDGNKYPFTTAGVQAAHDSLPATGGNLIIPPNSPIQGSTTTLMLTRPNLKVTWPKSSPFLAPTGSDSYNLVQIGAGITLAGLSSLLNANATHGAISITLVSTAGFAADDWVELANNAGVVQMNRIQSVTSGTVLRLYRPISSPLTTAAASGCSKVSPLTPGIEIDDLYIKNNGNTNPGLITGWAASQMTTITGNAAKGASGFTLTSAAGFATGDYILVRDSSQGVGESNGWVTIATLAGAVVTTNGPLPFALNAATAQIFNVGAGGSIAQINGNVGMTVYGCNRPIIKNFTADLITGSAIYSQQNYEAEYRDVIPYRCGFPYNGAQGAYSAAIQSYYDMGQYWDNCYSEDALSWGAQLNFSSQPRGDLGGIAPASRGVKFAFTYDARMKLWSEGGQSTGVAIADGSCFNVLDVHANGNADLGLWLSDQANTDNSINFTGVGNLGLAGDVAVGATDLRNNIVVQNENAVLVGASRNISFPTWQDVPFAAGNYSGNVGTWVLTSPDQAVYAYKRSLDTLFVSLQVFTTTVTGTPAFLKLALPLGLTVKRGAMFRITAFDNGVELPSACAVASLGDAFIKFYPTGLAIFAGAPLWTNCVDLTAIAGSFAIEVD